MLLFQFEMSVYRTNGRLHGISVFGPLIVYLRQVCDRFTVPSPNLASRFLLSNVTVWQQLSRVMYVCRKPVARYVETQWQMRNQNRNRFRSAQYFVVRLCSGSNVYPKPVSATRLIMWLTVFFKIYRFSCQQLW